MARLSALSKLGMNPSCDDIPRDKNHAVNQKFFFFETQFSPK